MSILIKGMEMPKNCDECHFYRYWDEMASSCRAFNKTKWIDDCDIKKERHPDCPLVPVPPNGRLIDADAIPYKKIMLDEDDGEFYYGVTQPYIDRMPTIIPAEDGE